MSNILFINKLYLKDMELRHLRYFIVVAEELNFTRAAERLHIAQPPLSQQIQALEAELKVQLFERKKRPLQLTAAGQVLLTEARLVFATVERAIISTKRANRGEIGRLVVGANSSIANSVLPDILRVWRSRFGDVELVLRELTSREQIQELRSRVIDVGFDRLPNENENDPDLSFLPILQESLVIALPEQHPLAVQSQIPLKALADEPFVLPPPNLVPSYSQIINLCQQVGFTPKVVQQATWMITVLSLVAGGVGVALLPANAQNLVRKGVVYREIQGENLTRQLAVIWRRDDSSIILREFIAVTKDIAH
ncbi:transcriptional regulatory protein LysR family [Tolypothrix sp. NIES-4075]|uniref:LysR family transcriptional regulator n=1 Tax=Tolypothrix sp. NIES-4075 TaxID=2005459 RepID=UPI000B6D92A5|nr:transcriptional regulatory protein LysR family [Tolypothrix sp. NIES-4075]